MLNSWLVGDIKNPGSITSVNSIQLATLGHNVENEWQAKVVRLRQTITDQNRKTSVS